MQKILDIVIPISLVVLLMGEPSLAAVSYILLAMYALFSMEKAVISLFTLWVLVTLNPAISDPGGVTNILRFIVIGSVVLSTLFNGAMRIAFTYHQVIQAVILVLLLLVHSIACSFVPDVSVFKVIIWGGVFCAVLSIWFSFSTNSKEKATNMIYNGLGLVAIVSLPLIGSGIGYSRNETGFQGIMSQPQAFGVAMCYLAVWSGINLIIGNFTYREGLYFGLAILGVFASETRSAAIAALGSIFLSLFWKSILTKYTRLCQRVFCWVRGCFLFPILLFVFLIKHFHILYFYTN